jgi:hypothetical protein
MELLVLQAAPQSLDKDVVQPAPAALRSPAGSGGRVSVHAGGGVLGGSAVQAAVELRWRSGQAVKVELQDFNRKRERTNDRRKSNPGRTPGEGRRRRSSTPTQGAQFTSAALPTSWKPPGFGSAWLGPGPAAEADAL